MQLLIRCLGKHAIGQNLRSSQMQTLIRRVITFCVTIKIKHTTQQHFFSECQDVLRKFPLS